MSEDVFRWVIAIAVWLACISFLVQMGVVLALYRVARKTQSKVMPLVDSAEPILSTSRQLLDENRPRISEISAHAVEIARNVRQQTEHIGEVVRDGSARAKVRMAQIDEKVDQTVEQVGEAGEAVKETVMKPVTEVNGLVAGLKAGISTFVHGGRRPSVDHATQDEEMFI